ncbi:MAG: MaoC family dehydratase N-terminal domain-containing protein [Caulobacteraceae bacterium]|nr:MaoC family dehydratase N-terminal domain-containing protein [Caulobacteraceae bacterium]
MSESFLSDEVMAAVAARPETRTGLITEKHIRQFCVGVDERDPLFLDLAAARGAGHSGVLAPPLFAAAAVRPAPHRSGLLDDGQYGDLAPPGLERLQTMLAGQAWEIGRPAVAGETVVETLLTRSITERQGATGPIVFVEKEASLATPDGELIERCVSTLILRRPPPPRPPFEGDAVPSGVREQRPMTEISPDGLIKRPDMVSLFMFCAAIWAVHRIHWDTPFAQSEGLPLPILPGWMVASYLAQAARLRAPAAGRLQRLAVRYKGMAHPGDTLACAARDDGSAGLSLSVVNQHGAELSSGQASFVSA